MIRVRVFRLVLFKFLHCAFFVSVINAAKRVLENIKPAPESLFYSNSAASLFLLLIESLNSSRAFPAIKIYSSTQFCAFFGFLMFNHRSSDFFDDFHFIYPFEVVFYSLGSKLVLQKSVRLGLYYLNCIPCLDSTPIQCISSIIQPCNFLFILNDIDC